MAQVTMDNSAFVDSSGDTTVTTVMTVDAAATGLLIGLAALDEGFGTVTISSVTVNGSSTGVALEQINAGPFYGVWIYSLPAPPTGTVTVVVTVGANAFMTLNLVSLLNGDNADVCSGGAIVDRGAGAGGEIDCPSASNEFIYAIMNGGNGGAYTENAATTELYESIVGGSQRSTAGRAVFSANPTTVGWSSVPAANSHNIATVSCKEGGGAAPLKRFLSLLGAGT